LWGSGEERKTIKGLQIQEETANAGVDLVNHKLLEGMDNSLRGVSSGFVRKRAKGELKKCGGIFART
jgi:hypothetical protein